MSNPNILKLGNNRKISSVLSEVIDDGAIGLFDAEIDKHCQLMFKLGLDHYRFAIKLPRARWRQKVSRLYYGAYSASKSVRYYKTGHYSTLGEDHKKVGDLPANFPSQAMFKTQLAVLREDRNLADYNHFATATDLAIPTADAATLVKEFLAGSKQYLKDEGIILRGKI